MLAGTVTTAPGTVWLSECSKTAVLLRCCFRAGVRCKWAPPRSVAKRFRLLADDTGKKLHEIGRLGKAEMMADLGAAGAAVDQQALRLKRDPAIDDRLRRPALGDHAGPIQRAGGVAQAARVIVDAMFPAEMSFEHVQELPVRILAGPGIAARIVGAHS